MTRTTVLLAFVVLAIAPPASAQKLDPTSSEALGAVLQMLTNPSQRSAAVAANPQASALDAKMRALAGSNELMEEFYRLAAQIFDELTRASGGDVNKMSATLATAQSDPAAFAAMLSPATLARLQNLASRMADQKR